MSSPSQCPSIIAIDGPAASGKSTLGLRLARHLDYLFFDTGIMYRAVTWLALDLGLDLRDESAITALAQKARIDIHPPSVEDGRASDVTIDGRDITWETRSRSVDANVSTVAAYPGVRHALLDQQRRVGLKGRVVMVGRDIGTVVLPNADLKVYLDATPEERARRRYEEITTRGGNANYDDILAMVHKRDRVDSTRSEAPLRTAADAVVLHSDNMTAEQVFERIRDLCE